MIKKMVLYSILFMMIWINCSVKPRPVYRLSPVSGEIFWRYGRPYRIIEKDLAVWIAFDRHFRDELIFHVNITNLSGDTVLVAPESFYFSTQDSLVSFYDDKPIHNPRSYALNPEQVLLEIDKEAERENADHARDQGFNVLCSVVDLAFDIATITKEKTEEEIIEEEISDQQREEDYENREIEHERIIRNLNDERMLWETGALRKTSLKPNASISGFVHFPIMEHATGICVCIPLGEYVYQVRFRQDVHDAKKLTIL